MKRSLLAALLLPLIGHAQTTEFGNVNVVQNDAGNATTSVTVTKGPGSSPNMSIRSGSTKADYNVAFGNVNDFTTGVLVATISENGRNNNAVGETIGRFYTTVGVELNSTTTPSLYYLALFRAPNAEEQNQNVACAFLPYSQWLGGTARNGANGNGGVTDTLTASAGINLGTQFTTAGNTLAAAGVFGLNLTSINASYTSQNGILLVNHLKNEDNYAASFANANGSFTMHVRDNGGTGTVAAPATEHDPIAFVYLHTSDVGTKFLKAMGRVNNDASTDVSGGTFTVVKGDAGQWFLTIPGMSPATGTLIVSPEGGATNNVDNIVSYQWDAANSRYVVESRDIVSTTAAPVLENGATAGEDMFSFAFFEAPIVPTVAITSPANGASLITGSAFNIEATAADANGTITQVEFLRNGVVVSTDTEAPFVFNQPGLSVGTYNFNARATDNDGFATTSTAVSVSVTLDPANLPANTALWFDGVNDYVTMGTALDLGVGGPPTNGMTLECWFRQDGAGLTSSSGSGGVTAVPLFGKGRGEGDGSNVDCNYFFGITSAGILVADFEAYPAAGVTSGQNYPITATNTPILTGEWHHAAATYDGATATWTMYLDGAAVGTATAVAGALPRYDSIQHFGIATAMTSVGAREGAFHGIIDEVRVWNYARSGAEIASTKDVSVSSSPGLVGRYGLNEGTGLTTASSTGTSSGTLTNGPLWIQGATLVTNDPPTVAITAPADNTSINAPASFTITATAADPDGTVSKVEFYAGATKLGEDTTAPYSFDVSGLAQGVYSYTARATDNYGAVANSAVITVQVLPPVTTPPTVSISSPMDGATFLAPATISISANAADSDGSVVKVEFFNGATKVGEDTTAPFSFDWTNVPVGSYSLTAKATDDMTATTMSTAITVSVIVNQSPSITLTTPVDLATNAGTGGTVTLTASVTDPESQPLAVTFYGKLKSPPVGPDFTLVTLPDTQFYSENTGGTRLANFTSQTNWIVANRNTLNIPFVAHMGDMVQNGDAVQQEWINADSAMDIIEDPITTLLTHGIPWGGAPGNHDQQPIGSPDGASTYWNQYFGTSRWSGRPYWGGNYSTNNDNNYQLFSASGLDFIVVNLEYRASANQAVLDWADALLKAHPTRRAIITSHWFISTGNPASWGGHGQAVYDNLKDNPNLFLMLCGHIHGEGQRSDTFEGRTVYTVLQDYQSRANGGDSWLRYFVFSPANNTITARTLQTTTVTHETDADSQFVLPYTMGAGSAAWVPLGTVSASGGTATLDWTGLAGSTEYDWYAAVSDGTNNVGSTTRSFTTASNAAPTVSLTAPAEAATVVLPAQVGFAATAADSDGTVSKVEFFAGTTKVGEDSTAPFAFDWTAISGTYALTAVATDSQGATATSSIVNITVTNPANALPTVSITSPASGFSTENTTLAISASAADTDGTVTKVEFYEGATKLGEDTTSPFAYNWTGTTVGTYSLTAVATDNDGGTTTSAAVTVTFTPPGNFLGSYTQNFDSMGTTGTTLPGTWSVKNAASGTTNNTWTISIPASDMAAMVNAAGAPTATTTPSGTNNNGFNAADLAGNTANRVLASSPTTTAGLAFQLLLTNGSGGTIGELKISYDTLRYTSAATAGDLPGYWLFFSLDGGATWSNASAFNPTITTVPNTTGATVTSATTLALGAEWTAGSQLLLRWVDDNATQTSPDQILGLDNVSIQLPVALSSADINVLAANTGPWNPAGVTVNGTTFVNLGLQGVGRIPANSIDPVTGESIGSISDMQVSGWKKNVDGSYSGSFHFLPDRGYNSGAIYSNYAARINDFTFNFTPYTGTAPVTAQNQVAMTFAGSRRFSYDHDGNPATPQIFTTGLLSTGTASLLGTTVPVTAANTTQSDGTFANRLTVDAEGLILDLRPGKVGSGWMSDEYGPYIYHFNAAGQIDGQVMLPAALVPHNPVGTINFGNAPANLNGRRENQGMEGIAQSPDGTKLFALLQSATLQDSASGNQNRFNTRLLVYDISSSDTPSDPIDQYVIQLPRIDTDLNGSVDRTGAQSTILALNDHQLLILSRDGSGRGATGAPVFKSVLLAELNGATDIDGSFDAEAAAIAPAAVLNASVTPLAWSEALNMLGKLSSPTLELAKFNMNINTAPGDLNSLSEKWEALSMVSANDVANPNDYFLFIGNDNDFASQTGVYRDAAGTLQSYDSGLENDSVILAYRVRMTGTDNQAPFVANSIANQPAVKGAAFSYTFPDTTFADPEAQTLTYSATRADGSPLPAWLTFNATTRTFSGTPTAVDLGNLTIRITATDSGAPALFYSTTFAINIAPATGSAFFPQSVASGDPRSNSVVLWTRLMDGDTAADRTVTLHLGTTGTLAEVGTTGTLGGTNLWTGGNLTAQSAHDGVVKTKVTGLSADTIYYYQFSYNGNRSPIGRTKTAPAAGSTRTVKYAAINCNDFVGRYFNVLRQLAEREQNNIDFVLNLGDYVYETTGDPSFQTSLPERAMVFSNPEEAISLAGGNFAAQSLGNYRDIYKTIRQDVQLQRVHELFPMISIWDDHEFSDDNWKDNATYFDNKVNEQQTTRKRNGERAWMEFLPTERGMASSGTSLEIDAADLYPNTVIYDAFNFGTNLDLILTDIRTNRADHLIPEDAFPATIAMDEATLTTVLGAPTWAAVRGSFAPYVNIDDSAHASVKAGLLAIVAGGVNANLAAIPVGQTAATTGAAYAAAKVTGNLDASFINSTFAAAGQPQPFDTTALNAMPRGLSFFLLGKTSFFSDFGSRYQVVDQTFQLYAGYMYQLFLASSGALGRDQAFYDSAQQAFLANALASSTAAGNKWRVIASSTPYTPIKLELGQLPAGVTLPTSGTIGALTIPATVPTQFLTEFLLNADEPAGFPQFRQGMIDLFAQHDAIIVSGDIHAELIGRNNATNGQKVIDFTVPSAASSEFRRAISGAFTSVEGLMTPGVQAATGQTGPFVFDTAQKQAVIDATDSIIELNTPEMFQADTATHGYTVFTAGASGFNADYQKINVSEIDDNLYALTPAALDDKFTTQTFSVSKTGAGAASDLALAEVDYTLQVLHYYGESGLLGVQTAPVMGALIDKFDGDYANTVVLAEGDSFIPGPWLVAGADPTLNAVAGIGSTALGRPDIAIMNLFGTSASALGNHEFDLGSPVLSSAIVGSGAWVGAQFPFITANLDFTGDTSLKARADNSLGGTAGAIAGGEVSTMKARIAPYAIKTINGQKVGFVGATNWELLIKSSPNGTIPKDDANPATSDLQEVAAYLQGAVNALQALGVNKIIQLDQLDALQRNKDLAGLVSGIDIVVAGGGHEYMKDANDVLGTNSGHTTPAADAYPIQTVGLDGKPVLIVTTDTEYSYLGRVVVDFDTNGELIIPNLNDVINGAYPAENAVLESVYGSGTAATIIAGSPMASGVKAITDAINTVISTKEGTVYGYTNVYLEGDRVFGRTQEVNIGNITADANAQVARTALGLDNAASVFSLKNGGGIRASVGAIDGGGNKVAPIAIANVKPAGAISLLDVENALRFDNKLMSFDATPQELLNILNFAAGLSSGAAQQSGGYPQVGGLRFSYDYSRPVGERVRSVVLYNDAGQVVAPIVDNGVVVAGAPATIRCVTLNFMAGSNAGIDAPGGDGYPIKANGTNFRYLLTDGTLSPVVDEALDFDAAANVPANALGEQKAFQDYLVDRHSTPGNAYNVADTTVANDLRIQQLPARADTLDSFTVTPTIAGGAGGTISGGGAYLLGSSASFTVTPDAGYTFTGWVVNGTPAGSTNPLQITVTDGLTVEATFVQGFTLQLLHFADGEAGLLASQTAPNLAALTDAFEGEYANTLILSGGDNFIPSPFLNAGTDPALNAVPSVGKTAFARPDIAIHNLIGVEASAIGNHEWDLGTAVFTDAIRSDGAWVGAQFPSVSANLDYSLDSAALGRFNDVTLDGATTTVPDASSRKGRLVPMTVITKGTEKIGVVGVTTQLLRSISSPSGTFVKGFPAGTTGADDMNQLATVLQPYINELLAEGINKIVLLAHLQQLTNERSLATKLTGVDIIVAAGSNTRLGDADDVAVAFPGHAANFADTYPIVTAGADTKPVLIVNTDNEYTYLGRLVAEFDNAGEVVVSALATNTAENGAYAATNANVAAAWGVAEGDLATTAFGAGTKGAAVKQVTDAVQSVINAKDGQVYGYTAVYLEGERAFVRSEETNLGNLTADANQDSLRRIVGGASPIVSIKNGGGIRAQIGAVSSAGGSSTKLPPIANPSVGKSEGGISQLDIENALRFNNRLMAFDTTPAGLKAILEHGVAAYPNQGRFPQIGGVAFAWDPARTAGSRITSITLMNDDGTPGAPIYKEGPLSAAITRAAPTSITVVTLNFMANDGDGYPMKANGSNFRYVLEDGTLGPVITDEALNFTVSPQLPANALGEQRALSDFLTSRYGSLATAYRAADTGMAQDQRIQNLSQRADTIPPMLTADSDGDGLTDVEEQLYGLNPDAALRLGENLSLNLGALGGTGSTYKLVGKLPLGLKFDPLTGMITGQLIGTPGDYQLQIQELQGGVVVNAFWLNLTVAPVPALLLGGYQVLLEDATGAPRGIVELLLTKAGSWTGSITSIGQSKRSTKGVFALTPGATQVSIPVNLPATTKLPAAAVAVIIDSASPLASATYTIGAETGTGRGARLATLTTSTPVSQALTMVLDAGVQDGIAYPAGMGTLRGKCSTTGALAMKGLLGDAKAVTLGMKLTVTGQAIVWSQPYTNKLSYLGGVALVDKLGQPLPFPQRMTNGMKWFKAADAKELAYDAGFAAPLDVSALSSRWTAPATSTLLETQLGLTASTLDVIIDGAGLDSAAATAPILPTSFLLSSKFALTVNQPSTAVPWRGGVLKADGGVTGSFTLTAGPSSLAGPGALTAVLLQNAAFGNTAGGGLVKVPVTGKKGAYRTASAVFEK